MQTVGPDVRPTVSLAVLDQDVVTVEKVELPERSAGEIDVTISVAAICGSDLHTVLGHRSAPPRTALGHEGVGRVAAVDDGRSDFRGAPLRRGDRVVFSMLAACGSCDRCAAGLPMKCRSLIKYGHESVATPPHATGTLASQLRLLPEVPLLRIPDDLHDAQVVSAGCAVATAAAISEAAGPLAKGTRVLVFGAGAVGAYSAAMFTSVGCDVRVREPSEARLAAVESLGVAPDDAGSPPFPVVVEASGSARAFEDAVQAADVGGTVVAAGSVSPGSSTATVDPAMLVTRRLTLKGIHNYTAENFRAGVDWLLAQGRDLGLERLLSPVFPLTAVDEAFRCIQDGSYVRILVRPTVEGPG